MTYTIRTEADTRSKSRRSRMWTITTEQIPALREEHEMGDNQYSDEDVVRFEARMRHLDIISWNGSIFCEVTAA